MIQFKKLIVHNFGSYGHAELELQNRGFCLVSGQNNYSKDNALSNGSGKSFLWSAICYALTGETINGIRTNLKNINVADQDCYVQLDFLYNKDFFSLIRTVAPKTELKIFKNDLDLSGKGIRESERKLLELLPDLTKDLIASTIIIGQGMPNKFSSFSPSGRKELLEKLTKSDFMIDDLKTRIQARQNELSMKVREFEDSLLLTKNQLNGCLDALDRMKNSLESPQQPNFDQLLSNQLAKINQIREQLTQYQQTAVELERHQEEITSRLLTITSEKAQVSSEELNAFTASHAKLVEEKARLESEASALSKEITKLRAIKDTCPTCGQHLPNVHKPDTSSQEALLFDINKKLNEATSNIMKCNKQHQEYVAQINNAFDDEITNLNSEALAIKQKILLNKTELTQNLSILEIEQNSYNKLAYEKQTWDSRIENQQKEINKLEIEIAKLTNLIAITSLSKEDFDQRLAVIKKMDQLVRRDFRGYLLTNIINYIDERAKDYCNTVFGTRELSLSLNGNALDITYCDKLFDGLSGGEKQKVDLILQLAIRDLLMTYLGLSSNILVLDEVTDFLDKKSCRAVMQLLEKELHTVESVFIISHHAEELELPIDSELKVVKNKYGISELY